MPLSKLQKLSLSCMGRRYNAHRSRDKISLAALTSYVKDHYDRELIHGNFRISLTRMVDRGLLLQHPSGGKSKAKTPSYQLTELGLEEAMRVIADESQISPPGPDVFFL